MDTKAEKEKDEAGDWLNMIARTSLLFNTKKEMAEHIGYPALANNNSLSRIKGDFKKRAILHELEREAKEYTFDGFDIEYFLQRYEEASRHFALNMEGRKMFTLGDEKCAVESLLDFVYGDHTLPGIPMPDPLRNKAKKLFPQIYDPDKDFEKVDMAILLALILGILPEHNSKKGDVDDIDKDFNTAFKYLDEYFTSRNYHNAQLRILQDNLKKRGAKRNRLALVYSIEAALLDYKSLHNEQERYELNTDVEDDYLYLPGIEDCFWKETTFEQGVSVFWRFTLNDSGTYFLDRYEYRDRELTKTQFEIVFLEEEGEVRAVINHPDFVKDILAGDYSSLENRAKFSIDCDKADGQVVRINFSPIMANANVFTAKELHRVTDTGVIEWYKKLTSTKMGNDYSLWKTAYAITREAIFFRDYEETTAENGEAGIRPLDSFYALNIGQDESLANVTLKDNIGILTTKGKKYIYIGPLLKAYDISTEDLMEQNGIFKTDHIC